MLESINEVLENQILDEVRGSAAFSLMFDETTDISCTEQMVIHARYIDAAGEVSVKFLKILDALQVEPTDMNEIDYCIITLDARTISGRVTDFIEENDLKYEKLSGIGTDGAPVMTGKTNGAVKRIIGRQCEKQKDILMPQKPVRMVVGQHCSAHKLNLVAKHAANDFPVITNF